MRLLVVLLLAGCTTSSIVHDETGMEAVLLECGSVGSMSACHKKAKEVCDGPYAVIDKFEYPNQQTLTVRCTDELGLTEGRTDRIL